LRDLPGTASALRDNKYIDEKILILRHYFVHISDYRRNKWEERMLSKEEQSKKG
jgi:hypothetical protein